MGDESYLNEKRMNEENNANLQVQNETDNKEVTKLEGVADSFRGLPMRELISAPLIAVNEAQQQLAASTVDYYNKLALEDDGKTTQKVHENPPFIGIVPVPALLTDDVNINFQMEVTDASTTKSEESTELTTDGTSKWFQTSVSIQGKVDASSENTRSMNQTAKYQVSVSASQQSQPEALSKLMDMMASGIEPLENK